MLKKESRITKKKEFDLIFSQGKGSYNKYLGIKTTKGAQEYCRFGIIVSAKVSKKAVQRNKIKRRIRAILLELLPSIKKNDYIIITLPPIISCDYQQIKESILFNLKKLKSI